MRRDRNDSLDAVARAVSSLHRVRMDLNMAAMHTFDREAFQLSEEIKQSLRKYSQTLSVMGEKQAVMNNVKRVASDLLQVAVDTQDRDLLQAYNQAIQSLLDYPVSSLLGKGESWFDKNLPMLYGIGFPPIDPIFKCWDADAIHRWLDQRADLADNSSVSSLEERLNQWRKSA